MNRKSRILIALLILAILATFTACGGAAEPGTKDDSPAPSNKPGIFSPAEPEKVSVTGIELSDTELTAYLGTDSVNGTRTASVKPENAEQKGVKFASADPSVVKVDDEGNYQALAIGTADITVTVEDPDYAGSASCTITVRSQVDSITLSSAEEILYADGTASLTAQVSPPTAPWPRWMTTATSPHANPAAPSSPTPSRTEAASRVPAISWWAYPSRA